MYRIVRLPYESLYPSFQTVLHTCLAQIIKVFFGFLEWIVRHGLRPADRTRRGCGAHHSWCVRVAQKQARHTGGRYNAAF